MFVCLFVDGICFYFSNSKLPDVDLASAFNIMIATSFFHDDSEVCRVGPWNGILPRPRYGGTAVAAVPEMKCSPVSPGVAWLRSPGRNLSRLYLYLGDGGTPLSGLASLPSPCSSFCFIFKAPLPYIFASSPRRLCPTSAPSFLLTP
jgi:hypothetical protein